MDLSWNDPERIGRHCNHHSGSIDQGPGTKSTPVRHSFTHSKTREEMTYPSDAIPSRHGTLGAIPSLQVGPLTRNRVDSRWGFGRIDVVLHSMEWAQKIGNGMFQE